MAISSVIVQPANNKMAKVVAELSAIYGVTVHTTTAKQEIIIIVEADSLDALNKIAHDLEKIEDVLGVFPAYITTADEEEEDN